MFNVLLPSGEKVGGGAVRMRGLVQLADGSRE